jgi:hypothetical protein
LDRDINVDELISQIEEYFYFSRKIPESVKSNIKDFLTKDET